MRITQVREESLALSRYADATITAGGLTTSVVSIFTDATIAGRQVVGSAHASIGRFAQGGLIRERFAPRLLEAGNFDDPRDAWRAMMQGEKPGGHGDRSVAVGALDCAVWDAAAQIAGEPLYRYIARIAGVQPAEQIAVYAGGGYPYPEDDISRLQTELRAMRDLGFERVKIKIGAAPLREDLRRIEAAIDVLGSGSMLAVDAMNAYDRKNALEAARALDPYGLWWFEDVCDPHDFATLSHVASMYSGSIAAGEALFSLAEAKLLDDYGGLRPERDILLFDPVHCYGVTGYMEIVNELTQRGWPRTAFWPHGGHALAQHIAAGLNLGGAECNPFAFAPLGTRGSVL